MRTVALLLLPACALALTPMDENEIRTAIYELAKQENLKGTNEVWSERGPISYRVGKIEELTPEVATAEAEGGRSGAFAEHLKYVFILTRTRGKWTVARKVQACTLLRLMPIGELRRSWGRGSSDYPN